MISNRSRYRQGVTAWVDHPTQGRVQVVHLMPPVWSNYPYVEHVAGETDTFDRLAHTMYSDATAWWFIADMNPRLAHPDDLARDDLIFVPLEKTR